MALPSGPGNKTGHVSNFTDLGSLDNYIFTFSLLTAFCPIIINFEAKNFIMKQLFNKNGLVVKNNLKAIQEELVRGTGFVMGEKVSAFVERESLHEKHIVISVDDGKTTPMEKRFVVGRMKEALELFQSKLNDSHGDI